jgi:archaemetzincin
MPVPNAAIRLFLTAVTLLSASGCYPVDEQPATNHPSSEPLNKERRKPIPDDLRVARAKLEPFFQKMGKPASADWLESHNEPGQTFEEYVDDEPVLPTSERQKLYIVSLGSLRPDEKRVVDITASYLAEFYDLHVEQLRPKPLSVSYPNARTNRLSGARQIRTDYILDKVLRPILPRDAAAIIAFTGADLYPNDTMNYVFGQASLENRVAVWSLARLDDGADAKKFLSRTLKIAVHETGHMFSIRHCTKYECVMSGTNHLGETDRRPIDACPECTAKICWLSDANTAIRFRRLAEFCRRNGLRDEAVAFERKAVAVSPG